jgi:flagellar basal-body rod modification protein FlgD
MAIESIGSAPLPGKTAAPVSSLGLEDFLKILLTQLNYQDPLKPLDNQQFIAQLAQFTTLEQTRQSNERLDTLLSIQSSSQAIGLLNRTVDIAAADGSVATGQVSALGFRDSQALITVKREDGSLLTAVPLSQINNIR